MKSRKYFLDYIETHRMEIFITAIAAFPYQRLRRRLIRKASLTLKC